VRQQLKATEFPKSNKVNLKILDGSVAELEPHHLASAVNKIMHFL
jgi:hypothetical protein